MNSKHVSEWNDIGTTVIQKANSAKMPIDRHRTSGDFFGWTQADDFNTTPTSSFRMLAVDFVDAKNSLSRIQRLVTKKFVSILEKIKMKKI